MLTSLPISASLEWDTDGDHIIAREMFSRLRMLLPYATRSLPHNGALALQAYGMDIEMVLAERPWFQVTGHSAFRMQYFADDWHIECDGTALWSELEKAQELCENMMHIWEQVLISFEYADRIV